jgi:hypothetical protein
MVTRGGQGECFGWLQTCMRIDPRSDKLSLSYDISNRLERGPEHATVCCPASSRHHTSPTAMRATPHAPP